MNIIEGKIKYVGSIKQFEKGFGVGFKIEDFEGYLNVFAPSEETVSDKISDVVVGNNIRVHFEKADNYNVVNKIELLEASQKRLVPEIKKADEIKDIDQLIDRNVLLFEKTFEAIESTKIFAFLKSDKGLVWNLVKEIVWDVSK